MYRLDAESEVWNLIPGRANVCGEIAWRKSRGSATVVEAHKVRCRREHLTTVERGVRPRNDGPRRRVRGGFACQIARFELPEGGVDVVEVEKNQYRQSP